MDDIGSILTRHFLSDINDICVASNIEDDLKLIKYLVRGRGGRILNIIRTIGVQDITCNLELTRLLLSLLEALYIYTVDEAKAGILSEGFMNGCDTNRIIDDRFPTLSLAYATKGQKSTGISTALRHDLSGANFLPHAVGDNESGEELSTVAASKLNIDALDVVNTECLDEKQVLDSIVSVVEQLFLNDIKRGHMSAVSVMILTVLLQLLDKMSDVKCYMTWAATYFAKRLVSLVTSVAIALSKKEEGLVVLKKSAIFESMFSIIRNRLNLINTMSDGTLNDYDTANGWFLEEALNATLGCIKLLTFCAQASQSESQFTILNDLVRAFADSGGHELTENCLMIALGYMENRTELSQMVWNVIWSLGELGAYLRGSQSIAQHDKFGAKHCVRKWNRRKEGFGNHHFLCNVTLSACKSGCMIATVGNMLLSLLTASPSRVQPIVSCILSALNRCGICCCTNPRELCLPIVNTLVGQCQPLRELSLRFLQRVVVSTYSCRVCYDCVDTTCESCHVRVEAKKAALDSGIRLAQTSPDDLNEWFAQLEWSVFDHYVDLLLSCDKSLLDAIRSHILAIISITNDFVRLELFMTVFLQLLPLLSRRLSTDASDCDELVCFCLDSVISLLYLPGVYNLLRARCKALELCHLLWMPNVRNTALKLLRILMLEEAKVIGQFENDLSVVAGVQQQIEIQSRILLLTLYLEVLLKHTVHYKNLLLDRVGDSQQVSSSDSVDSSCPWMCCQHAIREQSDLGCLSDLWHTVGFLIDNSIKYRRWFWSSVVQNVVSSTLMAITEVDADSHLCKAKWDLFGNLLHVAVVCTGDQHLIMQKWISSVEPFLRAELKKTFVVHHGHILKVLLSAALTTDHVSEDVMSSENTLSREGSSTNETEECMDEDVFEFQVSPWVSISTTSSTERGYDADSEEEDVDRVASADVSGASSEAVINRKALRKLQQPNICCPRLLRLVLDLVTCFKKKGISVTGKKYESSCVSHLTEFFHKLVSICVVSPFDAKILVREGVVSLIVSDFADVLTISDNVAVCALKSSLLQLYVLCASYSISPVELKTFLHLFLKPGVCHYESLLDCLIRLCQSAFVQPSRYIRFYSSQNTDESSTGSLSHLNVAFASAVTEKRIIGGSERVSRKKKSATEAAERLRRYVVETKSQHVASALNSSWAKSSIVGCFPPPDNNSFWLGGMTMSTWLSVSSPYRVTDGHVVGFGKVHLASFGDDNLSLEVWLNYETRSLLIVLVSSTKETYNVLDEVVLDLGHFAFFDLAHRWQHLAISWKATHNIRDKRLCVDVQVFVQRDIPPSSSLHEVSYSEILSLECQWLEDFGRPQMWYMLLGHCDENSWHLTENVPLSLASVMLFRGSTMNEQLQSVLHYLGPDVVQLDLVKEIISVPCVNSDGLKISSHVDSLRRRRVLSFLPQNLEVFTWYSPVPTSANKIINLYLQVPSNNSVRQLDRCMLHFSAMTTIGHWECVDTNSLKAALERIGGTRIIVFLFALLAEANADELVLSKCLTFLVNLIDKYPCFALDFQQILGWNLVMKVLSRLQNPAGSWVLCSFLRACISHDILQYDHHERLWKLNHTTEATVTDAKLLVFLVENWKIWTKTNGDDTLEKLLLVIEALVDDRHSRRSVNLRLLCDNGVLDALFTLCRKLAFDQQKSLSCVASRSIVVLLKHFLVKNLVTVNNVVGLLIAMQSISRSYICHARGSFFFLPVGDISKVEANLSRQSSSEPKSGGYDAKAEVLIGANGVMYHSSFDSVVGLKHLSDDYFRSSEFVADLPECDQGMIRQQSDVFMSDQYVQAAEGENVSRVFEYCAGRHVTAETNLSSVKGHQEEQCPFVTEDEVHLSSMFDKDEQVTDANHCDLSIIYCGMIKLLFSSDFISTTAEVVTPEMLVVLALNPSSEVRVEVIQAVKTYLKHVSDTLRHDFVKKNLFYLLANQLYQYKATEDVIKSCFGIVLDQDFSFQMHNIIVRQQSLVALPLLLALLPKTCEDTVVCHNMLDMLTMLCRKDSMFFKELTNHGLNQSLCLTLCALIRISPGYTDVYGRSERDLLLCDIHTLFSEMSLYYISLSGKPHFNSFSNIVDLLSYYELREIQRSGCDTLCVLALRDAQCVCIKSAVQLIQSRISWVELQLRLVSLRDDSMDKLATETEMQERLKLLIRMAVDFCFSTGELFISTIERTFMSFLFQLLVEGCITVLNKRHLLLKPRWHLFLYPIRNILRAQLGRLLVFMLSPVQPLQQKLFVIDTVSTWERSIDLIIYVIKSNPQVEKQFYHFLEIFVVEADGLLNSEKLTTLLKLQAVRLTSKFTENDMSVSQRHASWVEACNKNEYNWRSSRLLAVKKMLQKLEAFADGLSKTAAAATYSITEIQSGQYKHYLLQLKTQFSERLHICHMWKELVEQLTHERAVWHCIKSYPSSWKLDETEGPHRMRKRLRRFQLTVSERFVLPGHRKKLEKAFVQSPLAFLFDGESISEEMAVINEQLHSSEKIRCTYHCTIITPSTETKGELLLGNYSIYFVGEESSLISPHNVVKDVVSYTWHFKDIKEILKRRFLLQDSALELFLTNGKTYLVSFNYDKDRNLLYEQLMANNLPNLLIESDNLFVHTQMWRNGLITNFEYLTILNKLAGRTFNDLMQYPVVPFVLANYHSSKLDLGDIHSYRNLAKPMAVQNKNRETHYINQYNFLQKEHKMGTEVGVMPVLGPYHYGSHYSNSGIVLHFLVRMPLFTTMFLSYQDNNFDIPDRTFHSMSTSWRLSSSESTTDVKELIPEFFFLPEFLVNNEGFDFGVRQNGERVNDVLLPAWCRGDSRLFVYVHRQALESAIVTENIHQWIDLIFGFKQTGQAAVDALNVFHPATYFGFNTDQITDPLRRLAFHTMIKSFGQTPCQLFQYAHPSNISSRTFLNNSKLVLKEVIGLRWGTYVGSLDEPDPKIVMQRKLSFSVESFVSTVTNEVFVLSTNTSLLVQHSKDKGTSNVNTVYLTNAALIIWGQHDGLIWAQLRQDSNPQPFIAVDVTDHVTACGTTPDCLILFFGRCSGLLSVYAVEFEKAKLCKKAVTCLHGHTDAVLDIYLSKNFSIAVTASADHTCIIWDLNRLCYIRSITDHHGAVFLTKVSETMGEIVSVSNLDGGSRLFLHTINAKLIGDICTSLRIHSVCFSTAPEGISVNVVCAGIADGSIEMWSTWDLHPLRTIRTGKFTKPVSCLTYSFDCQHLYAANSQNVIVYEAASLRNPSTVPKIRTLV